jgi:hypothetical protein
VIPTVTPTGAWASHRPVIAARSATTASQATIGPFGNSGRLATAAPPLKASRQVRQDALLLGRDFCPQTDRLLNTRISCEHPHFPQKDGSRKIGQGLVLKERSRRQDGGILVGNPDVHLLLGHGDLFRPLRLLGATE